MNDYSEIEQSIFPDERLNLEVETRMMKSKLDTFPLSSTSRSIVHGEGSIELRPYVPIPGKRP